MTRQDYLMKCYEKAKRTIDAIMTDYGYEYPRITSVTIDSTNDKTIAYCRSFISSGRNEIVVGYDIVSEQVWERSTISILLHEILHAYFPSEGHKGNFVKYGKIIEERTRYTIGSDKREGERKKWTCCTSFITKQWETARKSRLAK